MDRKVESELCSTCAVARAGHWHVRVLVAFGGGQLGLPAIIYSHRRPGCTTASNLARSASAGGTRLQCALARSRTLQQLACVAHQGC